MAAMLAGTLAVTAALSVSAAELTEKTPDGSTEVTAKIFQPGEVSYVITIPDKVDFGVLTQPETDTNSYKYINFGVEATQLNFENGAVSVHAKDSVSDDGQFYLTQQNVAENPFKIQYDVYTALITKDSELGMNTPVNNSDPSENGYHITTFAASAEGETQDVTLALNQKALFGKNLETIAGDYSGTMVFHSALTVLNN